MVLSIWLIQYFGLVGIAMGTVVAFWFEKVFMIVLLETKYHVKMKEYIPIRYFAIYSVLMIIGYLAA